MTHYEKATKKFNKVLARNIYTVEAGLEELAAAHHISSGYGQYDRDAMDAWISALDRWEAKWTATPQYEEICDRWLA